MSETTTKKGRQIAWYRTPIDKDLLKQLNQRSDLRGFQQTLGFFGIYFALLGGALYSFGHWPWYVTVLLVYAHGMVASFAGGCATHELTHNTVFRTKWLNAFFAHFTSFVSWWSPVHFQPSHARHHAYTLHQPDDLEVTQPSRMPRGVWTWFKIIVLNPRWIFDTVRSQLRLARGDLRSAWDKHLFGDDPAKLARVKRWARVLLVFHALLLVTSVTLAIVFGWYVLLLLPLMISCAGSIGGGLIFLCGMPQHFGLVDGVPDFRLSCRTYTTNPLFGLLYWQMQYHTDHHMFPTVPCYNLKKLHKAIRHDLPPTPHGLIACWREMLAIDRKQREDPTYLYRPPLPQDEPASSPVDAPAHATPSSV